MLHIEKLKSGAKLHKSTVLKFQTGVRDAVERMYCCVSLNPRPTGGGGYFEPPLSFSCDIF